MADYLVSICRAPCSRKSLSSTGENDRFNPVRRRTIFGRSTTMRPRIPPCAVLMIGAVSCGTEDPYVVHMDALRAKLPHDGFHIVIERPFVVIGDQSPSRSTAGQRAPCGGPWRC